MYSKLSSATVYKYDVYLHFAHLDYCPYFTDNSIFSLKDLVCGRDVQDYHLQSFYFLPFFPFLPFLPFLPPFFFAAPAPFFSFRLVSALLKDTGSKTGNGYDHGQRFMSVDEELEDMTHVDLQQALEFREVIDIPTTFDTTKTKKTFH